MKRGRRAAIAGARPRINSTALPPTPSPSPQGGGEPTAVPSSRRGSGVATCEAEGGAASSTLPLAGGIITLTQQKREGTRPARENAGAPDYQEITPRMISAGLRVLWGYDPAGDSSAETVREIFEAMQRARPQFLGEVQR